MVVSTLAREGWYELERSARFLLVLLRVVFYNNILHTRSSKLMCMCHNGVVKNFDGIKR